MKKGLSVLLLLGGITYAGLTFAEELTVNFDNAKIVFIDEDNTLKKMDDNGIISDVLNTVANVSHILLNSQTNLFIVFSSRQQLSDGSEYLLTCANTAENTLVGIDSTISSIRWDSDEICQGVQVDGSGNLYYLVYPQSGGLTLRRYVNESNIQDLINDNIYIHNWLVVSDGTVLMSGYTTATSVEWIRKLTPETNLVNLASTYAYWMKVFPDNRVYAGIYSDGYVGVYKLPSNLSAFDGTSAYISSSSYNPEYDVADIAEGHDSYYSKGFTAYRGASIETYVSKSNVVYALAGSSSYAVTPAQFYPTPEIIEPTNLIDSVTLMEPCSDKLLIAGLKDSSNKLILYDPSTGGSVNMLDEEIEVYHMREMYDGHIWFDGLKFTGNRYIMGKIIFSIEYSFGSSGELVKSATPVYTEVATLPCKIGYFIGVAGTDRLTTPTGLSASDGTFSDKVRLTWTEVSSSTSYEVYRNTTNSTVGSSALATSTSGNYDDTSAVTGTVYYYWVKAINATNFSPFSESDSGYADSGDGGDWEDGGDGGDGGDSGGSATQYVCGDYDGDGKTDLALYHKASGYWYVLNSSDGSSSSQKFGEMGYDPVPGDYDGDGKADLAVYHEASGYWYILLSGSSYSLSYTQFGASGYTPVSGDFDADGKTDLAVYQESTGYWYILKSTDYSLSYMQFGASGYNPVPGDYDGDGKSDLAVYHESSGYWYILLSGSSHTLSYTQFGALEYTPVSGDFDADGKTDLAVYQESTGYWYILKSSELSLSYMKFGALEYTPVPGDYDGDGTTDLTVYHEASGYWYILLSGNSYSLSYHKFGRPGYIPVGVMR